MRRDASLRTPAIESSSRVTLAVVQTKLADGGGAADRAEHEADRVGDCVARDRVPDELPRGSASPLPTSMRTHLEPRVGCDLSGVRLHDDAHAHATASELGARAFTVGRDVYFARGQLAPETHAGRSLLGHELAHVGQQARGAATGIQRKEELAGKKPLLIDEEITNRVWVDYVRATAAKMKLSPDDPRVRAEAERLTAIRIGPTNFERFKEYAQPETLHIDPAKGTEMYDRMEKEREEEERQAASDSLRLPNGDPWTPTNQRNFNVEEAERLYARLLNLSKDVAAMERDVLKLKTPAGIEGKIYQYAGGAIVTVVGPTAGTLSKVASLPVQKIIAKARGTEDKTGLDTIADDQVSAAQSGYQLATGELHAIYESTRESYSAFSAAQSEFVDALVALRKTDDLAESERLFQVARKAQAKAAEAYTAYAIAVELAGIKARAAKLVRAVDDTAEGVLFTLESAIPAPTLGMGRQGKTVIKEGQKVLKELGLEGAEEVVTTAPKVLGDAAKAAPKVKATPKQAVKEAPTQVVQQAPKEVAKGTGKEAIGKAIKESDDDVAKLAKEGPANDVVPPTETASRGVDEVEDVVDDVAMAAGHDVRPRARNADTVVATATKGSGKGTSNVVPITAAKGKPPVGTAAKASKGSKGSKAASTPAQAPKQPSISPAKVEELRIHRIAKQAGVKVKKVQPTEQDLERAKAYYKKATPQQGGTAGHKVDMQPHGADIVSVDTVGELKMLQVVTSENVEKALVQAMGYAKKLGLPNVVVRVMDMRNGVVYEFWKLK